VPKHLAEYLDWKVLELHSNPRRDGDKMGMDMSPMGGLKQVCARFMYGLCADHDGINLLCCTYLWTVGWGGAKGEERLCEIYALRTVAIRRTRSSRLLLLDAFAKLAVSRPSCTTVFPRRQ
jgi:hypothetical protein